MAGAAAVTAESAAGVGGSRDLATPGQVVSGLAAGGEESVAGAAAVSAESAADSELTGARGWLAKVRGARAEGEAATARAAKPGRIASLDVARGWLLVVSVASACVMAPRPVWLNHPSWWGITPYDLIFPSFVTLSGIGMAFAYRNRVSWWVTWRRIVVLSVVGVIYGALATGNYDLETIRWTGTLQLYAGLVFLLAVGHLIGRNWWTWGLLTLLSGAALTWYLHAWGISCGGQVAAQEIGQLTQAARGLTLPYFGDSVGQDVLLTPSCNPSGRWDSVWLEGHMYRGGALGHDPEGIFGILGAFVTAAAGTTAGHLALALRQRRAWLPVVALSAWALAVWGYGQLLGHFVPAFKRLWTPAFGLQTAALGILAFAVAYLCFDFLLAERQSRLNNLARRILSGPFVALGRNSLLVYFGSHLLIDIGARLGYLVPLTDAAGTALDPQPSVSQHLADTLTLGLPGHWGFVIVNVVAWTLLCLDLHRRKVYIHA